MIKSSDIILVLTSTIITLFVAIIMLRWLAPGLLGISDDMILVKSSEKVPPYYEHILSKKILESEDHLIPDPMLKHRNRQMIPNLGITGPNDLLGFRNMSVPNDADVVIIGDSQTYGSNVAIWDNWPHRLDELLPNNVSVYSMATGGWGAVQYFYAFSKAFIFTPKIIIVAFYTGNDPLETYLMATSSELWKEFLPDVDLASHVLPKLSFPPPVDEHIPIDFSDGISTTFTPKIRSISNDKTPVIDAAYEIMTNIASEMGKIAKRQDTKLLFTIIPTKELVFSQKIMNEGITINEDFQKLIRNETERIEIFSNKLKNIDGAYYVDIVSRLQNEALKPYLLYMTNINGHPVANGYEYIADEMLSHIINQVHKIQNGFAIQKTYNDFESLVYINNGRYWIVKGHYKNYGTVEDRSFALIPARNLSGLIFMGHISSEEIKSGHTDNN